MQNWLRTPVQRFARTAPPTTEVLAVSYWRAARAASHPVAEFAAAGIDQLAQLARHPKLRERIRSKFEHMKVGQEP